MMMPMIIEDQEIIDLYTGEISFLKDVPLSDIPDMDEYNCVNMITSYDRRYKTNTKALRDIFDEGSLSCEALGFLGHFGWCLHSPTNSLFINNENPTQDQMCKYLNIGRTKLNSAIKELESHNIILRKKINGCTIIYFNPELYHTDDVSEMTKNLFIDAKRNMDDRGLDKNNYLEKDLENYLKDNLCLVEDGMTLIGCQYSVTDGYIDILAEDIFRCKCIIELKIKNDDTSLVFQSVYYPSEFNEKVRMITITPGYVPRIKQSLESLRYVELMEYYFENDELRIKKLKKQ
ncbi:DUF91 domain-containing protein [Paenibacillus spiritus]|uniref:DUF91 domain-containing protein n=2 Tax=Paenibacillus spiritus TaxID=2496557 RepID=A0A5J5GGS0_9BACL|nr:DUF91 domain-containing protein [Paenibacillus spiritus]